jgi:hypothetical protein
MNYMHKLSFKARLLLVMILVVAFGVIIAVFSIVQINQMANITNKIHDHPLRVSNASISADLQLVKSNILGKEGQNLEKETRKIYNEWLVIWQEVWHLVKYVT